jgi:3-hydroxyisobutyrate dehydrogenase/glyoxylate/succinic semialdehyde reductase
MGSRMAANLLEAGYEVAVWNRTREKAEQLEKQGARFLEPRELAAEAAVLITMLAHPQAVSETMFGDVGALSSLQEGSLWIDSSTVQPSFSILESEQAEQRGIRFLDAPVAGSKGPAEKGELLFLVGGREADFEDAVPLFQVMGRAAKHMGSQGKGTAMKMAVNYMLALQMAGFSEAAALAQSAGISQKDAFDTLLGGPIAAPFLSAKREKIEQGGGEPDFPLKWMHKDLHLASLTAYELELPMFLESTVKELFAAAHRHGYGDSDFSTIYAYLNERA